MNTQEILNKLDNMKLSERARNYINSCDQGAIATLADLTEEAIEKEALLDSIIGETYEDPEGIWEVTNVNDDSVEVTCIQEGNLNEGKTFVVTIEEVMYYLNGGK